MSAVAAAKRDDQARRARSLVRGLLPPCRPILLHPLANGLPLCSGHLGAFTTARGSIGRSPG
jgi:hypothetical protein